MEVDGIRKEQMSFSKKTPELLTFPDGLIGYITGPDMKELLSLLQETICCVLGVKLSDLIYPRNWTFPVTFFFKLNFSSWLDKNSCFFI